VETYDFPKDPEILVASIRSPLQVTESIKAGAHIATIPFKTMEMLFKHPLTDIGIKRFNDDYLKSTGGDKSKQDSGQSIEDKAKV
jgi:transaldolase